MTTKNSTRRTGVDGYTRVSQIAGRDDDLISPAIQRTKIETWAQFHGYKIHHWEEDLDVSGGKLSRPGLNRIMERIRTGQTGGLVVAKLDRFSRAGVGDALNLIEEIKECGGTFACIEPTIHTSDPIMGEFVLTIFLALARMERARHGANWMDARKSAIDRGLWITSTTPFGYRQRDDGCLEPDPVTAPLVTEAFRRRAAGESLHSIMAWLQSTGTTLPGQRKGRRKKDQRSRSQRDQEATSGGSWNRQGVTGLLHRRVYLGEVYSSYKRADGTVVEMAKAGAHPPLVDPVTWQVAQHARGPRHKSTGQPPLLLSGLVRCAGCQYTMNGRHRYGQRVWPVYECKRKSDLLCPAPAMVTAKTRELPEEVPPGYCKCGCGQKTTVAQYNNARKGTVKGQPFEFKVGHGRHQRAAFGLHEYVLNEMWRHLAEIQAQGYGADIDLQEIEERLKTAQAERLGFAKDLEYQEALGREACLARARALDRRCDEITSELEEARRHAHKPLIDKPVRRLRWEFENEMSDEDRRTFMAGMLQAVYVRSSVRLQRGMGASFQRVHIVWATDPPLDVPRQGRRGYVQKPFVFPDDADEPNNIGETAA